MSVAPRSPEAPKPANVATTPASVNPDYSAAIEPSESTLPEGAGPSPSVTRQSRKVRLGVLIFFALGVLVVVPIIFGVRALWLGIVFSIVMLAVGVWPMLAAARLRGVDKDDLQAQRAGGDGVA